MRAISRRLRDSRWIVCAVFLLAGVLLPARLRAEAGRFVPLHELFELRTRCVVAVEFFVETETERRPATVVGLVADDHGLIVLLESAIQGWLPPRQLKDFRVYAVGSRENVSAEYLGQDPLTGWHFLRAGEALHGRLIPCTDFDTAVPRIGDEVWGIGIMSKEFDFQPFLMSGRVALLQELPQRIGYAMQDVASPGAPVFARDGALAGWAGNPVPQERVLMLEDERYNVTLQNANGTGSFFLGSEVAPYLHRVPSSPTGQDISWLGVVGLQPIEPEAAAFLNLADQTAVVVSDVIQDGPAARAGIEKRDILVSLDGKPFPRFRPERVVTTHIERQIMRRNPGDEVTFGVVRGSERLEIPVTLGRQPKPLKEADRAYFDQIGLTIREFVLYDAMSRHLNDLSHDGVVANFVKPNSPAATAGLQQGDLIVAVDQQQIASFAEGAELLRAVAENPARAEFLLLVTRGTETQLMRVRMK